VACRSAQKIINAIAQLPGAASVQVLTGLSFIKLASQTLTWIKVTTENRTGVFGRTDNPDHLKQLLLELHMSTPSKYQSDAIHRSINSKLAWIESELPAQALTQDKEHHLSPPSADPSSAPVVVLPQSSVSAQSSLKHQRDAAPLELAPTKETRLTQFNLSTESVPVYKLFRRSNPSE
jgi:hypothetical protein